MRTFNFFERQCSIQVFERDFIFLVLRTQHTMQKLRVGFIRVAIGNLLAYRKSGIDILLACEDSE